jgi:hypothetical protein
MPQCKIWDALAWNASAKFKPWETKPNFVTAKARMILFIAPQQGADRLNHLADGAT